MNDKIAALVLSISDYKDNDLLLRVLTRDYGLLSLIARGAKKLSAHHRFSVLVLYEFIFDYKEGRSLFVVHNSRLLESYYVDNDLLRLAFMNIFLELSSRLADNVDGDYYEKLLFSFAKMRDDDYYLAGTLLLADVLRKQGFGPVVDACAVCGRKQVVAVSNRLGGFVCEAHVSGEELLAVEVLKKFRLINKAGFEHYDLLKKTAFDGRDFALLMNFFTYNSDITLRSYLFYRQLCG